MAQRESNWRLVDLVDFEVALRKLGEEPDWARERARYRGALDGVEAKPGSEAARRRGGLRRWLEATRGEGRGVSAGARVASALGIGSLVLGVLGGLAGMGVMRGLLHEVEIVGRAYNVWIFLGVCLGLQWLVLAGGLLGYLFVVTRTGVSYFTKELILFSVMLVVVVVAVIFFLLLILCSSLLL